MVNKRVYVDIVKGSAIFLMLWGHCIQRCAMDSFDYFCNPVFQAIYSFHMPLFMLVSGYLFFASAKKRDLSTLLRHRTQGMLQPIIMASGFNLVLQLPITWIITNNLGLLNGALLDQIYSLWFLWCVLSASIIVGIASKARSGWQECIILLLGFPFVALFPQWDYQLYMYPYFVLGYLYAKYEINFARLMNKLKYLTLPLFPIMLLFFEKKHYIYITPFFPIQSGAVIAVFRWSIGLVGSVFALTILYLAMKWAAGKVRTPRLVLALSQLGQNSLQIYCISVSLLSAYLPFVYAWITNRAGYNILASNMFLFNYVYTPALTLGYSLVLWFVVHLLKKTPLHRLIFGRS